MTSIPDRSIRQRTLLLVLLFVMTVSLGLSGCSLLLPGRFSQTTLPESVRAEKAFIPDVALLQALSAELDTVPEQITRGQIASLGPQLFLQGREISDLTGLEDALGVTRLHLHGNDLTDLSPLSALTQLRLINLDDNQVSDLKPLSGLVHLEYLLLDNNQVEDLAPLASLSQLQTLTLDTNRVTDLLPVSSLSALSELQLSDNQITDIGPLAGLTRLVNLSLDGNEIDDLVALSGMKELAWLILSDNQIQDVAVLVDKTDLWYLTLSHNQIAAIEPLSGLLRLETLDLGYNQIQDLRPLQPLKKLDTLVLSGNPLDLGQPGQQSILQNFRNKGTSVYVDGEGRMSLWKLGKYQISGSEEEVPPMKLVRMSGGPGTSSGHTHPCLTIFPRRMTVLNRQPWAVATALTCLGIAPRSSLIS